MDLDDVAINNKYYKENRQKDIFENNSWKFSPPKQFKVSIKVFYSCRIRIVLNIQYNNYAFCYFKQRAHYVHKNK